MILVNVATLQVANPHHGIKCLRQQVEAVIMHRFLFIRIHFQQRGQDQEVNYHSLQLLQKIIWIMMCDSQRQILQVLSQPAPEKVESAAVALVKVKKDAQPVFQLRGVKSIRIKNLAADINFRAPLHLRVNHTTTFRNASAVATPSICK